MSGHSQFALFKTQRFLPLYVTQAIGAFNDNAFRLALATLYSGPLLHIVKDAKSADSLLAALLVLPFFLFSALAGQLAEKFDKAVVARRVKMIEVGLIAVASMSLFTEMIWLQMACVFGAGTIAAFFGPVKYSILPQHLSKDELLGGNGMIETGTAISILLGMLFGSYFILGDYGQHFISAIMVGLAVIAWASAWRIPPAPSAQPGLKINWNIVSETWTVVKQGMEKTDVWLSMLGISWFWFMGVIFLSQIQNYTTDSLHADLRAATAILAVFSVATGAGSAFCNRLLGGKITLKFVPLAALLLSLFSFDLYFATNQFGDLGSESAPVSVGTLFTHFSGLRALFDLAAIAFCSGLFVVPMFALMQARTPYYRRARIVAANNIVNAIFMVVASLLAGALLKTGLSVHGLYMWMGLANLVVVGYLTIKMPQTLFAAFARGLLRLLYRVEVKGMEHFEAAGKRALIVPNHTSFLDGPLLSCFLPERCAFAINTYMAQAWWVKPAFFLYHMVPIDPANPLSLRELVKRIKLNQKVVIFPEGRLTVTGGLMKVYEGPAAIANLADAKILPLRIEGALYSPFSRMRGKLRLRLFPKITLTFLPPVKLEQPADVHGAALRHIQAEKLYDVMANMMFKTSHIDRTLWQMLLDGIAVHGKERLMLEDIQRKPITYGRILLGSLVLGRKITKIAGAEKHIGVLLPNSQAAVLTMFGLMSQGRVPAMLNFSTGAVNMSAGCTAAQVHTIVTSRKFIEAAEMQGDIEIIGRGRKVVYLEDVRESLDLSDKAYGLWGKYFPKSASRNAVTDPNAPAFILFTSGSEGVPKGVVLSHKNLNSNWQQAMARIDFSPKDVVFNTLPVFHAFGLLAGVLLPLFAGIRSFQYPSPLHYKIIPELCYDTDATVLFGTDTFLAGYAKNAHPYDFYSMRLVVAGAERLKPDTRAAWMEKFGLRILEGYGVTECSPALSINTPLHFKPGTVGQLFDDIEYRVEPVPGIEKGGRLFVRGPNVMLGYLRADNPGVLEPPKDGWHDTGDIVEIDAFHFITILGRAKRFAKIAGEMVSLTSVETMLQKAFPDLPQAVVAVPDAKKGEQLVLFSAVPKIDRKMVSEAMKANGATELMIPKNIIPVESLPLLGSGKTDYVSLNRMALEKVPA